MAVVSVNNLPMFQSCFTRPNALCGYFYLLMALLRTKYRRRFIITLSVSAADAGGICDEIAAVAIRGIVSMVFLHIQGHGRDNPFPIQAIPICPSGRFLLKRSIFLRILAYKRRFSAKLLSANCPQLPILRGFEIQLRPLKSSSNFLSKIKFLRQRLKIGIASW